MNCSSAVGLRRQERQPEQLGGGGGERVPTSGEYESSDTGLRITDFTIRCVFAPHTHTHTPLSKTIAGEKGGCTAVLLAIVLARIALTGFVVDMRWIEDQATQSNIVTMPQ
jgi:hypothetical protein